MQTFSFDVSVVTDSARVTPAQIESAITGLGYPAKVRPAEHA